jgi:hypothetical protein
LGMVRDINSGRDQYTRVFGGVEMAHWIVSPNRSNWLRLISTHSFTIYTGLGVHKRVICPYLENVYYIFLSKPFYMALTLCPQW